MNLSTDYTSISSDLLSGMPSVRLIGNTVTEIVNHKGLKEYSEEMVSVNTKIGVLYIEGSHLLIKEISAEGLRLEGRVKRIAYA